MSDLPSMKRKNEEISDTLVKKHKDALTITMPIDISHLYLANGQEQISSAHAFDGKIWRLHVKNDAFLPPHYSSKMSAVVHCEGDGSSELWKTHAEIQIEYEQKSLINDTTTEDKMSCVFVSWEQERNKFALPQQDNLLTVFSANIRVTICTRNYSFARRPILDAKSSINDVTLVLEGQKIPANKQFLAAQSRYFNRLFFGNFKKSKQRKIEIKNTDPEDFGEMIKMAYGISTEPTTVENATRFLTMADMFDLQIVKDRMENFLLSTNLISIHRKISIAEEHKLKILKEKILRQYKSDYGLLRELARSPEYAEFPGHLAKEIMLLIHG